ncbi:MAG: hypothetical protein COB54_03780 [Alphaproteobacteria bacterium]|nr:MAG: hypothetical protein COB54_03780 [Alphaproteobacteria bacterium]
MAGGLLPEHIGPLVDRLRAGDHQAVSLPDVAALTEVLMRSLESYFKSIDLTIYQECQSLADYIDDARVEISSLSPEKTDSSGIPRAGLELEAIVQQTESATNTIMESAEQIMDADPSDAEAYTTTVNDAVMQIFEACSFQDITGQRISKVVSTLQHVEERVAKLVNILGVMDGDQTEAKPEEEVDEDKALLNGPALEGEGIDQAEIDKLLNGEFDTNDNMDSDSLANIQFDQVNDEPVAPTPSITEDVAEPAAKKSTDASPDDIDFMFASSSDDSETEPEVIAQETPEEVIAEPEMTEVTSEVVAEASEDVEPEAEVEPEPNLIEQAKQRKAQAQADKKAQARPPKPVEYEQDAKAGLEPKVSENTTQSDIDALFS